MLTGLFSRVLTMSLNGSIALGLVWFARLLLRRESKAAVCLLWIGVVFRLICPVGLELPFLPEHGISSSEMLVHNWQQTVMEDTITLYSHTDAYADGIREGRQPLIHEASGAFYLLAGEDDGLEPSTAEDVLFPALAKVWQAGVAAFALWNLVHWLMLRRKLTDSIQVEKNWVSDHISTPFVLGLIRPKIYLPSGLDDQSKVMVLAHERCHVRRGDPWLKVLLLTAVGIHWFNPLVWLGYWTAVQDMEMACDEAALRKLGRERRSDYAQALLRLSAGRNLYERAMTGFGAGTVRQRIIRVLDNGKRTPLRTAVCILLCMAFVPVMIVDAAPPWPTRWIGQFQEESTRMIVHPENEYSYGDEALRQKQRGILIGFLQLVEEEQISLKPEKPLIQAGTMELIAGTERYELALGYGRDDGRAHLVMSHCGGPEDAYLIENVPLITFVEHLFSHFRTVPIHSSEVTPDMVLVEYYQQSSDSYIYVYQAYCQTCQMYGTKYSARGIAPMMFGKRME